MKFLKKTSLLIVFLTSLFATSPPDLSFLGPGSEPKIGIKNTVLAKVHGKTITVMDLIKKMDYAFYRTHPDLAESDAARYQFYTMSWKHVLDETINAQLILADAESKELKATDSEIRKQMEERFGPNILMNLDKINLSYDDAWNMVKDEIVVQKMSWFKVNSKALQKITPQKIRKAYKQYCVEHPSQKEWKYQIVSIKASDKEKAREKAEAIYQACTQSNQDPESICSQMVPSTEDEITMQVSEEYQATDQDLSNHYKQTLSTIQSGCYSLPILQKIKNSNESLYRIFYLKEVKTHEVPSFDELANKLEHELLQEAIADASSDYVQKLRSYYEYEHQKVELSDRFEPFEVQ